MALNLYVSLDRVRRTPGVSASTHDEESLIDLIEAISRLIDAACHTWFIPRTETRNLEYNADHVRNGRVYFDADLISVSQFDDRGGDRTLTEGTHFILQPENAGPPYHWAEILRSQGTGFEGGSTTTQQSFQIAGSWGRAADTVSASQLGAAIADGSATTLQMVSAADIEVGDTLLCQSEQVFVSARTSIDAGIDTNGALGADDTETTVTFDGDPTDALAVGEVIRIGSEHMLITAVNSTTPTVIEVEREYDGTILAAHVTNSDVYAFREFTITRGVNGTTAAAHSDNTAVSKYVPPATIRQVCLAETIAAWHQQKSGWGRTVGTGEQQRELSGRALSTLRSRGLMNQKRMLMVSI